MNLEILKESIEDVDWFFFKSSHFFFGFLVVVDFFAGVFFTGFLAGAFLTGFLAFPPVWSVMIINFIYIKKILKIFILKYFLFYLLKIDFIFNIKIFVY